MERGQVIDGQCSDCGPVELVYISDSFGGLLRCEGCGALYSYQPWMDTAEIVANDPKRC